MYQLPDEYKGVLIKEFDCLKTYGADEFFASKGAHVAKSEAGEYFEAAPKALSRFGYRFSLKNANRPHMLIVSYPDDKRRHMMINDCFSYDLSCGVFCGGEYEVSGIERKIYQIFWPRTTDMTITFTSWGDGEPAAAFGFCVYELDEITPVRFDIKGDYERRRFGVQYEDPCGAVSDLGAQTFEQWADKFIEYAKHTGQNSLVHPINWYCGPMYDSALQPSSLQYWLTLPDRTQYTVATTAPYDWISPFLDKCEEANIEFIGGLTLLRLGNLFKGMNVDIKRIIAGEETYNNMRMDNKVQTSTNDWTLIYNPLNYEKMIAEGKKVRDVEGFEFVYGEKRDRILAAPIFNPLHPEVQRQIIEYFEEISKRFGNKKAFGGVAIHIWHATLVWFGSLAAGYDDYTINLFTKETGIKIPCGKTDADRFFKRYEFLTKRNRSFWINWRCKKIYEFILKLRDAIKKYSPKAKLYLSAWNEPVKKTMFGEFTESSQYPVFLKETEFLKEGGIDLSLFENEEDICIAVEQNQHRDRGWTNDGVNLPCEQSHFFHDLAYMDTSWINELKNSVSSGAFVMDSWTEGWGNHVFKPFNEHNPAIDKALENFKFKDYTFFAETLLLEPDGFWFESQRQITSCFPVGRNYLEPFAHAVAKLDPVYMFRGGLYLDKSHAKELREYAGVFTRLPAVKFETCKNENSDVATVRYKNTKDGFFLYAVNCEPYSVWVTISLNSGENIKSIKTGENILCDKNVFSVCLPPFGTDGFYSENENCVLCFEAEIPKHEKESLIKRFEYQKRAFLWLKENGKSIAGMAEIEAELENAIKENHLCKARHILKCYVSAKARELYENNK